MPTKGQKMNSAQFTQLIREAVAGTYDPAGQRFILTGLKGEWVPEEAWANFRPDGVNEDLWNAISKEHRLFQGTIQWDFNNLPPLLEMWAGAGEDVTPPGEEDFARFLHALPPHGPRDLVTFSLERGERDDCERCTYAMLLSIDMESDRDGERVGGNFTLLCRAPIATGVAMTGATQQGKVFAFSGGDTPAGNYNIGGGTNFQPGTALATIQGYVRALAGFANAVLAGSSVAAQNDTNIIDGNATAYVSASGGATAEDATIINGIHDGTEIDDQTAIEAGGFAGVVFDESQTFNKLRLFFGGGDADGDITVQAQTSDDSTNLSNGTWTNRGAPVTLADYVVLDGGWIEVPLGADYTAKAARLLVTASEPNAKAQEFEAQADIPGELGFTITLPFANGDTATPAVNGAGADIDVQTPYADGIVRIPPRVPLMPQMMTLRQADTRAGLAAANPIDLLKLVRFGMDNLVNPEWFSEENVLTYQSHTDGEGMTRTIGYRLAKNSTYAAGTIADSREQPAKPRWREIRFVHPDTLHKFQIQMYCSPSGAAPIQAAGNIRAYEFPLGVVLDDLALEYDGPESDGASVYMIAQVAV